MNYLLILPSLLVSVLLRDFDCNRYDIIDIDIKP